VRVVGYPQIILNYHTKVGVIFRSLCGLGGWRQRYTLWLTSKWCFLFHLMYLVVYTADRGLCFVCNHSKRKADVSRRTPGKRIGWVVAWLYIRLTIPTQIPDAGLPGRWRRSVVGYEYGLCFMSPFWGLEFWSGSQIYVKLVHPCS
jgi:hypothetical protein